MYRRLVQSTIVQSDFEVVDPQLLLKKRVLNYNNDIIERSSGKGGGRNWGKPRYPHPTLETNKHDIIALCAVQWGFPVVRRRPKKPVLVNFDWTVRYKITR